MTKEQKIQILKMKNHLKELLDYNCIDKYTYNYLLNYNILIMKQNN